MRRAIVMVGLVGALVMAQSAGATTLAGWDFSPIVAANNWGASPMAPTTSDANVAVVGLTRGWTTGTGTPAAAAWGGNNFQITTATEAAAIAANNFATISFTAQPGYELSLTDIAAYNIRRSASGPNTGIWQYQLGSGGFTDIGSSITWGAVTTSAGNAQSAVDLSGIPALQNVAAGTTVTVRCVTWGATTTGGTWYFNDPTKTTANDLVVDGALTAVPEPATLTLLALSGLLIRRRRAA